MSSNQIIETAEFALQTLKDQYIGRKVQKKKKPFKSGFKVNTVKGIVCSPYSGKPAFIFDEDDSIVNICKCKLV